MKRREFITRSAYFQGENAVKLPRRQFLHLAAGAAALPATSQIGTPTYVRTV